MTEAEWLAGDNAHGMLLHIHRKHVEALARMQRRFERAANDALDRRVQLFMVACCRRVQHLLTCEWHRFALNVAEEYTPENESQLRRDLMALRGEFQELLDAVPEEVDQAVLKAALPHEIWEATDHLLSLVSGLLRPNKQLQARRNNPMAEVPDAVLVRDIFGNPFRHVVLAPEWLTFTTAALAREMYDSRDFSTMPILADALQDAGCDNEDILNHCRGDGPHVRGCWVVDLLTGRT